MSVTFANNTVTKALLRPEPVPALELASTLNVGGQWCVKRIDLDQWFDQQKAAHDAQEDRQ